MPDQHQPEFVHALFSFGLQRLLEPVTIGRALDRFQADADDFRPGLTPGLLPQGSPLGKGFAEFLLSGRAYDDDDGRTLLGWISARKKAGDKKADDRQERRYLFRQHLFHFVLRHPSSTIRQRRGKLLAAGRCVRAVFAKCWSVGQASRLPLRAAGTAAPLLLAAPTAAGPCRSCPLAANHLFCQPPLNNIATCNSPI